LKRAEEKEFLLEQQRHQNVMQEQQQAHALKLEEIAAISTGNVNEEKTKGYFSILGIGKSNEGKLQQIQEKQAHEPEKIEKKTDESVREHAAKATIDATVPPK
jgi:uncharacterized protein YdbL (DUF1318 family)